MSTGGPEWETEGDALDLRAKYETWRASLTLHELSALRAWQGTDRYYKTIQAGVRDGTWNDRTRLQIESLYSAIDKASLPLDVVGWRGIRSSKLTFGVDANALHNLLGLEVVLDGFLAVTLNRQVAMSQFTDPELEGGAVLIRLTIPRGTPAAYVSAAGDQNLTYQRELLLGGPVRIKIDSVRYPERLAILHAEVVSA